MNISEYVIKLRTVEGDYRFYLKELSERGSSTFLEHTTDRAKAKQYSLEDAKSTVERLKEFGCVAKAESALTERKEQNG
jgi:hypothetical protein